MDDLLLQSLLPQTVSLVVVPSLYYHSDWSG